MLFAKKEIMASSFEILHISKASCDGELGWLVTVTESPSGNLHCWTSGDKIFKVDPKDVSYSKVKGERSIELLEVPDLLKNAIQDAIAVYERNAVQKIES
jgi:hypothetical protein